MEDKCILEPVLASLVDLMDPIKEATIFITPLLQVVLSFQTNNLIPLENLDFDMKNLVSSKKTLSNQRSSKFPDR